MSTPMHIVSIFCSSPISDIMITPLLISEKETMPYFTVKTRITRLAALQMRSCPFLARQGSSPALTSGEKCRPRLYFGAEADEDLYIYTCSATSDSAPLSTSHGERSKVIRFVSSWREPHVILSFCFCFSNI